MDRILAYRHSSSAEEIALKIVDNLNIPVVVAGSIDSWERVNSIKRIQPGVLQSGLHSSKRDSLLIALSEIN